MNVLVTGGGGFLGRELVSQLLEKGHAVTVLGRSDYPDLCEKGVRLVRGDICDEAVVAHAVKDQHAVFHVAAKAGVWGAWEDFYTANVVGSRTVLKACQNQGVEYLIHTSTPSVVFNRGPFRGADNTLPYGKNWLCAYAQTKAIAEEEMLAANNPGKLRVCALRPHLIWGTGDPHLLPRVIAQARTGRLRQVGDGLNRVDITHVTNAAIAHVLALEALQAGRAMGNAYFISQGEPVVLWDWINALLVRLDIPPVRRRITLKKAYAIGAFCEALWRLFLLKGEPPITRFVAVELGKDHWFDLNPARKDLGYVPLVSTEVGLDAYIASLKM
jgi:nucleoside-diphosphate-sugar epimerase